jgi:hypothetical protein
MLRLKPARDGIDRAAGQQRASKQGRSEARPVSAERP